MANGSDASNASFDIRGRAREAEKGREREHAILNDNRMCIQSHFSKRVYLEI